MGNQIQIKKKSDGYNVTTIHGYSENFLKCFDNEKDALQFARLYDANNMNKEYKIIVI